MKLFKEIKLKNLFLYTFIVFASIFFSFVLISFFHEIQTNRLFSTQNDIIKLSKMLQTIKNQQDKTFLLNQESTFESEDYLTLQNFIYLYSIKIDSLYENYGANNNKIVKNLDNLKQEATKYNLLIKNIVEINQFLYAPQIGIVSRLKLIEQKIRKEKIYQNLNLIPYLDFIKDYHIKLLKGELTKKEFSKKCNNIFDDISEIESDINTKYYLLLFEDNITEYYNNATIEYNKIKEKGLNYNEGLLFYADQQYKNQYTLLNNLEFQIKQEHKNLFLKKSFWHLFIVILIISVTLILFRILYNIIYKPWSQFRPQLLDISQGKLPVEIHNTSNVVEFFTIGENISQTISNLREKDKLIKELTKRNYSIEFNPKEDDEIGKSIFELKNDLIKAEQESNQYQETEANQKWTATGIAKIGAVMRQHTEDIESLSKNVLKETIEYIGAVQGAMYIYNPQKNQLELTASFSYGRQRNKANIIKPYEGLLGIIMIEKREYYFSPIPDEYVFLETGIGYSKPTNIFAFPLLFEKKLFGIIEIASIEEIKEFQRNFLLMLAIEIAITISYTEINVQTIKLLKQSNKQAQELQSNEKLFKKNQDNLKSLLRMTEQRLNEREDILKYKEELIKQKVNDLLQIQKELSDKEEALENITNEYENIKSQLENSNAELRKRIEELENRLRGN